jgi:hypothetical protein
MPKSKRTPKAKPKREKRDFSQIAFDVVQKATGQKAYATTQPRKVQGKKPVKPPR